MKNGKVLRAVFAAVLLMALLLVCSACTNLQELKKQREKEARKQAVRQGLYDTVLLPADR